MKQAGDQQKTDKTVTIQELKDMVQKFGDERNWEKHFSAKNLAMNIAIEAAELMEHFVWEWDNEPDQAEVAAELSDIIFNCLNFAVRNNIDISQTFLRKYQKLVVKYPVELFNKDATNQEEYKRIKQAYRQGKAPK